MIQPPSCGKAPGERALSALFRAGSGYDLGSTFERDDRQLPPTTVVIDSKRESIARLPRHQRAWFRARRTAWPALSWFDPRPSVGRSKGKVNLVGLYWSTDFCARTALRQLGVAIDVIVFSVDRRTRTVENTISARNPP